MAKLILTHEVDRLGVPGDVVEVKDGYARNFLLPRGLATPWTKGAQRQIDQMEVARRRREISNVEDAQALRDKLAETPLTLEVKAGSNGRLFGAVTAATIAEAAEKAVGASIDRRKVVLEHPVKTVGEYSVKVRLHPEVEAKVNFEVVPA